MSIQRFVIFSVLALVAPTTLATNQTVISQYVNSTGLRAWELYITTSGAITFAYTTDGSTVATLTTPSSSVSLGTHEIAMDRDGSGVIRFYVDGAMVYKATMASAIAQVATSLSIGNNGSISRPFTGKIDNVRIWKDYYFCGSDNGYTP